MSCETEAYNSSPSFLFSFSNDGLITRMNQAFLNRLGYNPDEIILKKFNELLTVGSKIFYQTHFFPLIKLHGKFNEIFLSFLSKDGEELPVLLNVVFEGTDEIYEIHCGGLQIAQRNRFEKELLEAKAAAEKALLANEELSHYKQQLEHNQIHLEKRLRELSQKNHEYQQINTVISHDLQEPLRKVALFSNKLLTEEKGVLNDQIKNQLEKINTASDKMRGLIISLQQFLSINEKQHKASRISLETAFKDAWAIASSRHNRPVKLITEALPKVTADYDLIVQLFKELITNSLKFSDPERALEITVTSDRIEQNIFKELEDKYKYEAFVRIVFRDNGIGFDPFMAEEIFSLFRKAHQHDQGPGIGLSYCKKITELHGGFISAKGETGNGAAFTILLPTV